MTQTAVNYAKALYDLSVPREDVDEAARLFKETPELLKALGSPVTPGKGKRRVIDRVFPKKMRNFLKVVCENHDTDSIEEIFAAYREIDCEVREILQAKLCYVTKPDDVEIEGIKKYLVEKYKKRGVKLDLIRDESLIGGFLLIVGDMETDWSFKGRLRQLQQKLMWR